MGKFIHKSGNHNLFLEIQRKKFTVIYFLLKNLRVQIFSKNKSIFFFVYFFCNFARDQETKKRQSF